MFCYCGCFQKTSPNTSTSQNLQNTQHPKNDRKSQKRHKTSSFPHLHTFPLPIHASIFPSHVSPSSKITPSPFQKHTISLPKSSNFIKFKHPFSYFTHQKSPVNTSPFHFHLSPSSKLTQFPLVNYYLSNSPSKKQPFLNSFNSFFLPFQFSITYKILLLRHD